MAIAYDSFSEGFINSGTLNNLTHTCSGSDRILFHGGMTASARTYVSVNYNGSPLTVIQRSAGTQPCVLYCIVAPSTGSNTLAITTSASGFSYNAAVSYTGASQTGQPDASNTNSTTNSSVTTTVTTVADNSWAVLVARNSDSGDTNASTNSTERAAGAAGTIQMYDSNGVITPAGSFSMTVTNGASHNTTTSMASFSPAGGAATLTHRLMMMDCGI